LSPTRFRVAALRQAQHAGPMCVRYVLHEPEAAIRAVAEALGVHFAVSKELPARYNVAPSQTVPVIVSELTGPRLAEMRWGFTPPADRGAPIRRALHNARAETVTKLPAFREACARRRCLVPANGFYEFKDLGKVKEPYVLTMADGRPFAFAGLWEPPEEDGPPTFCILTSEPNAEVAAVHNRMPVLLQDEAVRAWLGSEPLPPESLGRLVQPAPPGRVALRRVNSFVNNSRNEGPKCLEPPDPPQPELF
jgi:putative SOS response-associated peptidase YedK